MDSAKQAGTRPSRHGSWQQDQLTSDFFVILRGLVAIVEGFGDVEKIVGVHGLPNLKR